MSALTCSQCGRHCAWTGICMCGWDQVHDAWAMDVEAELWPRRPR